MKPQTKVMQPSIITAYESQQEVDFQHLKLILCEVDRKGLQEKFEVKVTKKVDSLTDTEISLRSRKIRLHGNLHGFRLTKDGMYFDRWGVDHKKLTRQQLIDRLNQLAK